MKDNKKDAVKYDMVSSSENKNRPTDSNQSVDESHEEDYPDPTFGQDKERANSKASKYTLQSNPSLLTAQFIYIRLKAVENLTHFAPYRDEFGEGPAIQVALI